MIHTDPASGFTSLINDQLLQHHRRSIEKGRIKNINRNSVTDKAVQELENELLYQDPTGYAGTWILTLATASQNSHIRSWDMVPAESVYQPPTDG